MTNPLPLPFRPEDPRDAERFQVLDQIQANPLERTFRAWDRKLDREVLLKVPPEAQWAEWSARVRDRIERESKLMAKVRSPQVLQVFDVLPSDIGPVIVMEVPEGEPLVERLQHGVLTPAEARRLGIEIARVLAVLHLAGVVYRALGPRSVLLTASGVTRLGDFTFAKNYGNGIDLASLPLGKGLKSTDELKAFVPPYPAPEQVSGRDAGPRGDIFALGCLLYRSLVGVDPLAGGQDAKAVHELRKARPDCPPELVEIIRRCTAMAPTARFATAAEVQKALEECPERVVVSRRGVLAMGVGGAALLGGGAWWLCRESEPPPVPLKSGYGKRWALLIGVNRYDQEASWNTLKTAENDISLVHQRLRELGWAEERIRPLVRKTKAEVLRALIDMNQDIRKNGNDDALLVYFAGHGMEHEGHSVLLPVDASPNNPKSYIEPGDFSSNLTAPKHILYVVDACHSGGMKSVVNFGSRGRAVAPGTASNDSLYHKKTTGLWRGILWSATIDQQAIDRQYEEPNSPFCKQFCKAIDPAGPLFRGEQGKMTDAVLFSEVGAFIMHALEPLRQSPGSDKDAPKESQSDEFVFTLPKAGG